MNNKPCESLRRDFLSIRKMSDIQGVTLDTAPLCRMLKRRDSLLNMNTVMPPSNRFLVRHLYAIREEDEQASTAPVASVPTKSTTVSRVSTNNHGAVTPDANMDYRLSDDSHVPDKSTVRLDPFTDHKTHTEVSTIYLSDDSDEYSSGYSEDTWWTADHGEKDEYIDTTPLLDHPEEPIQHLTRRSVDATPSFAATDNCSRLSLRERRIMGREAIARHNDSAIENHWIFKSSLDKAWAEIQHMNWRSEGSRVRRETNRMVAEIDAELKQECRGQITDTLCELQRVRETTRSPVSRRSGKRRESIADALWRWWHDAKYYPHVSCRQIKQVRKNVEATRCRAKNAIVGSIYREANRKLLELDQRYASFLYPGERSRLYKMPKNATDNDGPSKRPR